MIQPLFGGSGSFFDAVAFDATTDERGCTTFSLLEHAGVNDYP